MSVIATIIDTINTSIAALFTSEEYANKKIVGLAWPYPEKQGANTLIKIVPAQYAAATGEGTILDINDSLPLMIYHRLTSLTYQQLSKGGMGDKYQTIMNADAYMIVWAKRSVIQVQADELNEMIAFNLPTSYASTAVIKSSIAPAQTDFDFIRVFRQEYQSVDYFLKPDHILFQIKYKVVATVKPDCLQA